jgi:transcription-repair coupling factor (superfamily II helicase)
LAQEIADEATSELFARILNAPAVQSLLQRVEQGGVWSFSDIEATAQPFFAALLRHRFVSRPIVVVMPGLKAQELAHQDLSTWNRLIHPAPENPTERTQPGVDQPLFYPEWEILPHEMRLPHSDVISERLETLVSLVNRAGPALAPLIVTTVVALLQKTFPAETLRQRSRLIKPGDRIDPLDLVEWLEAQGYEPEAQVTSKGELALRSGGILDIYPPTSPWPVRLEFFGDEVESLRFFDPLTQLGRAERVTAMALPPAGELGLLKKAIADAAASSATSPALATLLDYCGPGTILVVCHAEQVEERAGEYSSQVPAQDSFFVDWDHLQAEAVARGVTILNLKEAADDTGDERAGVNLPILQSLEAFRPLAERAPEPPVAEAQRREFFAQLHRWLRQDHLVTVFCNNDGERQRFLEVWRDYGFDQSEESARKPACELRVLIGMLARGFLCAAARCAVVTDAEIFGRYKVQRPRRLKSPHAQATRSALDIDFTELEEGDYVVHLQHGIGRYLGLQILPAGAGTKATDGLIASAATGQECLVIEYAASDPAQLPPKLYVPVTESHLVSKYVGTGKARPPLNTLGGTRWAKAKAQAERAVRDVASELLAIQAARESQPGHAFAPDNPWQREFEGSFLFEETPDQMKAIVETKADMERPKPMDRLICGDVGFGKTEVGIRAAFKAVMDGRQVAVLVPTTVLAQQHFNTFRERMADYPVRIELLSRFRTRRQQQDVVRSLAAGGVDIVIGTHRLLQSDITFKDLGLVVIDEEQRFGVMHKEKFKMLRKLVDVLTLSATPIPRTLYLALTGARDMSTIQTPPHDRLPVETIVTQYDERVIRDSIQRELNRGGQVFFLHNRVMTIQAMQQKIETLVPHARIVVGHGQMHADDLEEVMTKFVNGEADVLLSTTIIESGLDIPNANTIIIDRADRFGLSDLYQLRGRVGRYKHQAYAYLLLPRHASLLADVRKRLSAIKQYSTLGSGFKIAMRDLEIRGAGNLLGAEQSGHITAVGFDLYCQLLKQSVSALKGEKVRPRIEVQVRLDFVSLAPGLDRPEPRPARAGAPPVPEEPAPAPVPKLVAAHAYIPFKYIPDSRQRIDVYRKLAQASEKSHVQDLERELRDRFGTLPAPLQLLLQVAELRVIAAAKAIAVIEVKDDKLMLTRNGDYIMVGSKFPRLTKKEPTARIKEIKKVLGVL